MSKKEGAALLAQDDSKAKNHSCILQAFDAAVKAHDLKSALGLLEMKPQDTVKLMRGMFPSFDKTVLSKCGKPEKYGCVLHPAGYDVLRSMAAEAEEISQQEAPPEPQKPKKRFRHKDGNKRRTAEIVADSVYFGGSKRSDQQPADASGDSPSYNPPAPQMAEFEELDGDDERLPF